VIYHVAIAGRTVSVDLNGSSVTVDGRSLTVDIVRLGSSPVRSVLIDGASRRVAVRRVAEGVWDLQLGSRGYRAEVVDERTRVIREMTGIGAAAVGPRPIRAPMPGMVVRVEVAEGDVVRAGQGIVIVEAMKMENELLAEAAAVVRRVHVREGEPVEKDQLLVDLGSVDEESARPGGEA
jgi:pyruvate carboxylase subunit B